MIALRAGNLSAFDAALAAGEDEFVKRRIYLTLERGRDVAVRNLLRRVYVAAGRESRVPLGWFEVAVAVGEKVEGDEVECLIANIIYKVCIPLLLFLNALLPALPTFCLPTLPIICLIIIAAYTTSTSIESPFSLKRTSKTNHNAEHDESLHLPQR